MVTHGTVIDRITRVGDIGEPGYSAYGQSLRKCTYSGSKDHWHGATQDALSSLLPTCYITESVYSFLTKDEIESVSSRIIGIVPNSYAHKVYGGIDSFGKSYHCWEFKAGVEARPLPRPRVPSHPFCVGGTFHQVHKYPDADEYVVSGIVENYPYCDGDILLPICTEGVRSDCIPCPDGTQACRMVCEGRVWKNTGETCPPYVPPKPECTEGDKKPGHVCSGGKWVPVGTPPPPPECTDGDKKPGYVCSGGKWVPITTPQDVAPEYLTAAEAAERFRMGLPCYIKCVLPILDMLPGIPYTPGAWVPPFCAITTEA